MTLCHVCETVYPLPDASPRRLAKGRVDWRAPIAYTRSRVVMCLRQGDAHRGHLFMHFKAPLERHRLVPGCPTRRNWVWNGSPKSNYLSTPQGSQVIMSRPGDSSAHPIAAFGKDQHVSGTLQQLPDLLWLRANRYMQLNIVAVVCVCVKVSGIGIIVCVFMCYTVLRSVLFASDAEHDFRNCFVIASPLIRAPDAEFERCHSCSS